MSEYEAVIGLEVHVQVRTESKMFCSCPNRYGEEPNTLVCPVCMGYPGVLPTPNKEAIHETVIAGLMTDCAIAHYSKFDRKSYFYPDMPKNYQLSQYDLPFCEHGRVHIYGKGFSGEDLEDRYIGITRIHLEEDVAKLTHFSGVSGVSSARRVARRAADLDAARAAGDVVDAARHQRDDVVVERLHPELGEVGDERDLRPVLALGVVLDRRLAADQHVVLPHLLVPAARPRRRGPPGPGERRSARDHSDESVDQARPRRAT